MFNFFAHILNIVWGTLEDSAPEPIEQSTAAILDNARAAVTAVPGRLRADRDDDVSVSGATAAERVARVAVESAAFKRQRRAHAVGRRISHNAGAIGGGQESH
jgi:hypothetical protein